MVPASGLTSCADCLNCLSNAALIAPSAVQAGYDHYDFNFQPWSPEAFWRKAATMGEAVVNSTAATARHRTLAPGRSFFI